MICDSPDSPTISKLEVSMTFKKLNIYSNRTFIVYNLWLILDILLVLNYGEIIIMALMF